VEYIHKNFRKPRKIPNISQYIAIFVRQLAVPAYFPCAVKGLVLVSAYLRLGLAAQDLCLFGTVTESERQPPPLPHVIKLFLACKLFNM
jgi:hypothetical protein